MTTDEQREVAIRALLDVAQDRGVRPSMRIAAASAVLNPDGAERVYADDDMVDSQERVVEEVNEDIYDAVAERVVAKVEPAIERLAAQFREQIARQIEARS